jgi:hypothetical protein
MSLVGAIDRLARVLRQEVKRNPDFADRLEAALLSHSSRRPPPSAAAFADVEADEPEATPDINPAAIFARDGAKGLEAALAPFAHLRPALLALIAEHNLDPAGEADALDTDDLVAHILREAERRVERDKKLFDY